MLTTAGFVEKEDDLLLQRRPVLRVADAVVRFHDLVIAPRLAAFEERRPTPAWQDAQPTLRTQFYGPAFEALAREWAARYASSDTLGGPAGEVGSTVVNDPAGRSQHQIDVVVLAAGQRRQARNPTIQALGEAKDSDNQRTEPDLLRLDRIRSTLSERGVDAANAKLLLFGRSGFTQPLVDIAATRDDIELIDLDRIRHGT